MVNSMFHYVSTYTEQQRTLVYDMIPSLNEYIYDHTLVYSHLSLLVFIDLAEPQEKEIILPLNITTLSLKKKIALVL